MSDRENGRRYTARIDQLKAAFLDVSRVGDIEPGAMEVAAQTMAHTAYLRALLMQMREPHRSAMRDEVVGELFR